MFINFCDEHPHWCDVPEGHYLLVCEQKQKHATRLCNDDDDECIFGVCNAVCLFCPSECQTIVNVRDINIKKITSSMQTDMEKLLITKHFFVYIC